MSSERILASQGFSNITRLGEGAFGAVYGCTTSAGDNVAIKLSFDTPARVTAKREATIMSTIPAHRNILPVLSFKDTANYTMMSLPLATGGDTLKLMQERSCVPLADVEIQALFAQLVDAVDHMHSNGFVHRDIKCENVLLTGSRRRDVLLADFGFATSTKPGQMLTESWGSLHYSAPEICSRISYDGTKVDIWSMGVLLFAWATGRLPFGGNTDEQTSARICAGLFTMPSTVSPTLASLIRAMLTVDPSKRISLQDIRHHEWMLSSAPLLNLTRSTSDVVMKITPTAEAAVVSPRRNSAANLTVPARLLKALFRKN